MYPNRLFFTLLSFIFLAGLVAQEAVPADYLEELETFTTASQNKAANEAFTNFTRLFLSGAFTEAEQAAIVLSTRKMQERKVRSQGGFVDYYACLEQIKNAENGEQQFKEWHTVLNAILDEAKFTVLRVDKFLKLSRNFLYNRILDEQLGGNDWTVSGGVVSWSYDGQPKLLVRQLDRLSLRSRLDSLEIIETQIEVDLLAGEAKGQGGKVDWQKVGLPPEVNADLVHYSFGTNKSGYTASEAKMRYPAYFGNKEMVGTFQNQASSADQKAGQPFPQFTSQDGYVEIKNVGEGIELAGNFEIRGNTVYAIGDEGRKAAVQLSIDDQSGQRKLFGRAERFTIRQAERIGGEEVETTIYFGKDSLYHPSVTLKVDIPQRIVQLIRTKSGNDRNPFYHSLNKVNIYSDYLDIYLNQDSILIGKPTISFIDKGAVRVESEDFFSKNDYYRIQNIAESNPLALMLSLRNQEVGSDFIDTDRIAKALNPKFTTDNIQSLLFELVADGFITYDVDEKQVRLKPKVAHYVRADRGEKDFDRIQINSETSESNGVINLRTGEITLEAVKPLEFNKPKRIAVQPAGERITISGDRDFDFHGKVFAGYAIMLGNDFHFKYAPYHIVMDSIRYLDLFIPDPNSDPKKPTALSIASRIEHVTGTLLLDAPKNKSGKQDIDIFPALKSDKTAYIYYDKGDANSAYQRDSFYFEVAPFNFNSLHKLNEADVKFKGQLNSGGIFPLIEETVSLQEDGSLGFISPTEESGASLYRGRGNYQGDINLSNAGLSGKGQLSYIGAEVNSEDIRFELDRATASAEVFNLEEASSPRVLPQVRGNGVNIDWRPYSDSLLINSTEKEPFHLFKSGSHDFDGTLVLTPEGLKGSGQLDWPAASMNSKAIEFGTFSATADTATVRIRSLESDERLALSTENVNTTLDFEKGKGDFKSNTNALTTSLPYNQFQTSIEEFNWDMNGNTIGFQAKDGEKGRFTSTHPDQDSLTFLGKEATYDLSSSMLQVKGVEFIKSADAFIYLADGKVQVEPAAKITTLENAKIIADSVNQYHVINRATVDILGRRKYKASGFYEYNVGPHQQELELQNITGEPIGKGKYSDKATATRAEGKVEEGTSFYIDHKTLFRGTINLDASSKNLYFDGYAKIEAVHLKRPQWFTVESEGDKKNLTLKIDSPKDVESFPLHTGFYLGKKSRRIYPILLQTKEARVDHGILPITGVFKYDEERDIFLFGDSSRVIQNSPIGNLLQLDNRVGKLKGEGMLGVGSRMNYIKVKSYGRIEMEVPSEAFSIAEEEEEAPQEAPKAPTDDIMLLDEEEEKKEETSLTITAPIAAAYPDANIDMMAAIDIQLPGKLLSMMANDIKAASFASPSLNLVSDGEFYRDGVRNLFPAGKELEAALQGMALGYIDLDKKINPHTLLFSRLKVRWNQDYQSFVSTEKTTGLVSLGGESINKMLEIHTEFKMTSSDNDDRFYIYIKSPSELFYFFGFKDGILNVASNNTSFMDELGTMKAKDLVLKMPDGGTYEILPVELSTASTFLRRVQSAF